MTHFNLFALTRTPGRRVLRIPLSNDVQAEVTDALRVQEATFKSINKEEFPFDGKYKPDEGECLVIESFDDVDDLHGAIANPLSIQEISPTPADFRQIKAIFSGYKDANGRSIALIQHFDRRKVISSSGLSLFHSSNVYRKVDGVGITLDVRLSAILEGSTLKFENFFLMRQIFKMDDYYNVATDADVSAFADTATLHVPSIGDLLEMSDTVVRRKIAILLRSRILNDVPIETIIDSAAAFGIRIEKTQKDGRDAIVLPNTRTELKKVLRFLDEDYHHSVLLSEQYISNSRRRLA